MAELRYNPLLQDWVMIASHRQNRPQMPKEWCPFCPGSGKVPKTYVVHRYDNDFPALSLHPPNPDEVDVGLLQTAPAYGKCEVILYSPEHTKTMTELSISHIRELVDLWCERLKELSQDKNIKYIFIFENRGEAVGVTMPHPHGQIYAYPYIPKKLQVELDACLSHHQRTGHCLLCDIGKEEREAKVRVILENEDFVTVLPFYSEYPYGLNIYAKRHFSSMLDMTNQEKDNLARILKDTTGTLDALFSMQFPYMMCFHQAPVNSIDVSDYYHFHIEFYPPMRDQHRIKFNASSETGAWAPCNPSSPEEKAVELRAAFERMKSE